MILRILFLPLFLALALLALGGVLLGIVALIRTLLPVRKVPLTYNLRNLAVRWKTTLMTALAFTLVTGLICVMLAFVQGMYRITQASAVPGNVIVLKEGALDEVQSQVSNPSVEIFPSKMQKAITRMKLPGSKALVPMLSKEVYVLVAHVVEGSAKGGRQRRFIQMRGLEDPEISAAVHDITLAEGTWFSDSGVGAGSVGKDPADKPAAEKGKGETKKEEKDKGKNEPNREEPPTGPAYDPEVQVEVVLGDGIAKTLGNDLGLDTLRPGDVAKIGPIQCLVVGVMAPGGSFGSEVWGKDTQIRQIFNRTGFNSFVFRTKNDDVARKVAKAINKGTFNGERFNASCETDYYQRLERNNQTFQIAVLVLGVIMSVGGVLGVMNTMFAAISQRARDIGVLRLLGFTRFQILCSFLLESLMIAALGGLLGCAIALWFDGLTANSIVGGGQGGGKSVVLRLVVDGSVLMTGMIFAIVMGAVGGLIPSVNAMRLRPLESLR